jgi:hypothetical protein
MALTERCEYLETFNKVVQSQLGFNVMNNSESFVEGMLLIRGAQSDLNNIHNIAQETKKSLRFLQEKIVLNAAKTLYLERKKRRL